MTSTVCSYTPEVPSKTIPDSRPKWTKSVPGRFQTQKANWTKTLPTGVAHTYMAYLREYPPLGLKYFNIAKKDYNKRPPLCMMARGH